MTGEVEGWSLDDDPWAGMVDDQGFPLDLEDPATVAAEAVSAGAENVRLAHLPAEFWGARELFKQIWFAAKADGTAPDAVLGAVLARASAMASHRLTFHSTRPGVMNMFVNIIAPSGIGKTEAMRTANRLIKTSTHLCDRFGDADAEKYKESGLGTGEGIAEAYMGTKEIDTGEFYRSGPNKGDPKTKPVRTQVRHNAFLFLDEGEALTKMMHERRGATVGMALRTAWVGGTLGQANAAETTTRHIPDGHYSLGIMIGYQPHAAQELLADGGGGTPQRFLWLSALDPDMAEAPGEAPEPVLLPLCDGAGRPTEGVIQFPDEVRRTLWASLRAKMRGELLVDELDSHEPLMRCKVAALLCALDGRMRVDADDWRLAGLIWSVSCAVRDRLREFGRQQKEAEENARRDRLIADVEASEAARIRVSDRIVGYARRIAVKVHAAADQFERVKRSEYRRNFGKVEKPHFDDALNYAVTQGWVILEDDGVWLNAGSSRPK